MKAIDKIKKFKPCAEAVEWLGDKTVDEMIDKCSKSHWLMWLAILFEIDDKLLLLAKARCLKTISHLMKDTRSITAIEVLEQYALGNVTHQEFTDANKNAEEAAISLRGQAHEIFINNRVSEFDIIGTSFARDAVLVYAIPFYSKEVFLGLNLNLISIAMSYSNYNDPNLYWNSLNDSCNICREVFGSVLKELLNQQ